MMMAPKKLDQLRGAAAGLASVQVSSLQPLPAVQLPHLLLSRKGPSCGFLAAKRR
jgi:hypothetical protein